MARSSLRLRERGFTERYVVQDGEIKPYRQFHTDVEFTKHEVSISSEVSNVNSEDNDKDEVVYRKQDGKKHVLLNEMSLTYGLRDKHLINVPWQHKQQTIKILQERCVDLPRWGRKKNISSRPQGILKLPRWGNRRHRNSSTISQKQESRKTRWRMLGTVSATTFHTGSKHANDCGEISMIENQSTFQFQQNGIPSSLSEEQTYLVDYGGIPAIKHPVISFDTVKLSFVNNITKSGESASSSEVQLSNHSFCWEPPLTPSSNKQSERERNCSVSTPCSMRSSTERITECEKKDDISHNPVKKPKKKKHRPKVIHDMLKKAKMKTKVNKECENGHGYNGSSKRDMRVNIHAIAKHVIRKKRTMYNRNRRISFKHMLANLRNIYTKKGIMFSSNTIHFQSPSPSVDDELNLYTPQACVYSQGRECNSDGNEITVYNHPRSQHAYKQYPEYGELANNLYSPDISVVKKQKMLLKQQESNNLQMVLYNQQRDIVVSKFAKARVRAKVQMDIENDRIWPLLALGGIPSVFEDHTYWTRERTVMKHRVDNFIQRMQNVQGHRFFSPWKGSIVDSVVGAFLTQNVSDHLSSSAFMSVKSRFPVVQRNKKDSNTYESNTCYNSDLQRPTGVDTPEPKTLKNTSLNDVRGKHVSTTGIWDCNLQRTAPLESTVLVEDLPNICSTSNPSSNYTYYTQNSTVEVSPLCNSSEASNNQKNDCTTTSGRILLTEISLECYSGVGSTVVSHRTLHDELYQETAKESPLHNYASESKHDEACDSSKKSDEQVEEHTVIAGQINTHDISFSPRKDHGSINERIDVGQDYVTVGESKHEETCGTSKKSDEQVEEHTVIAGQINTHDISFSPRKDHGSINERMDVGQDYVTVGESKHEETCDTSKKSDEQVEEHTVMACQISTNDISFSPRQDYGSINERVDVGQDYVSVDQKQFKGVRGSSVRRALFASRVNDGVTASLRQPTYEREKINEQNQNIKPHLHSQEKTEKLKADMTGSDSDEMTNKKRTIGGIERAYFEENQKGRKRNHKQDWEPIRQQALELNNDAEKCKQHEREDIYLDTVDWEVVRQVSVEDLADTIKERGMHHVLSGRIKNFLNRVYEDHGSIDLEWLRKLSPEDARAYLMSIRGLGVKSVECIRLLTLHHVAFPVDVNVGRICVRLGWVPIEPLPEELQLHLLELYPIQETIQKYLWPRLCTLDQKTLYELHYQLITFGKVFCAKSKPNCNACPMRTECKHFASACSSAKLHLTGPEDQNHGKTLPNLLTSSNIAEKNLSAAPLVSEVNCHSVYTISDQQTFFVEEPLSPEYAENELIDIEDFSIYNNMNDFTQDLLSAEDYIIPQSLHCDDSNSRLQGGIFQQTNKEKDESYDVELPETTTQKNYSQNQNLNCSQNVEIPNYQTKAPGTEQKSENAIVSIPRIHVPAPKLKNEYRLRTVHYVYELPDDHYLLEKLEAREKDDPCFYLLAIWSPGETPELGKECDAIKQTSTVNKNDTVPATLLIPCRTAMRGSFPLNGTYFQVNEVFADHESSLNPFLVPRSELWNLPRRFVYFGTSIPNIFRGLSIEDIQSCFLRGYVCVRGFDRQSRAPKPLSCRLHFPISKQVKLKKGGKADKSKS